MQFEEAAMVKNKISENLACTAIMENMNLPYPCDSDNLKKAKGTQIEKIFILAGRFYVK